MANLVTPLAPNEPAPVIKSDRNHTVPGMVPGVHTDTGGGGEAYAITGQAFPRDEA